MNLFHCTFASVLLLCTTRIVTAARATTTTTPTTTTKQISDTEAKEISDQLVGINKQLDQNADMAEDDMIEDDEPDNSTTNSSLVSRNARDVGFYLYREPGEYQYGKKILLNNKNSLRVAGYNSSNPVIMIIHGFSENYTTIFSQSTKDEYLINSIKSNIILVDWGKLSTPSGGIFNFMVYPLVVENVLIVGKRLSKFIRFLLSSRFLAGLEHVHLVGFDLGAHVAGVCAYHVLQNVFSVPDMKPVPLGRITGLDPTGPMYQFTIPRENKLDSTDALFVDVIHTNQGIHGYSGSMGHVDFLANGGGPIQTGCRDFMSINGMCAHRRAYQFFLKSISDKNIMGCLCSSNWDSACKKVCKNSAVFGHHCPNTARGTYYVDISLNEEMEKNVTPTTTTTAKP